MGSLKRQLLAILIIAILLSSACGDSSVIEKEVFERAIITATWTLELLETSTPTPMGSWKTVIQGLIYDNSAGSAKPITGASISYLVAHSYFPELQEGRRTTTITDELGKFSLPVMVHDTDHIRILIEAPGYLSYEEELVGVDLSRGKNIIMGLIPLATATISPP